METTTEGYLKVMLRKSVRDYYAEMVNNSIVSFGDAGNRILKKIMPLEIRRTVYKSVQRRYGSPVQPRENDDSLEGYVEIVGPEPIEVGLISRNEVFGFKGSTILNLERPEINIDEMLINYSDSEKHAKRLAKQLFSEMEKTASFVLVSGFGGSFAQNMHLEFSDLLSGMGIAQVNIVVIPSKTETEKRKLAQKGIRYLKRKGRKVISFDNDRYFAKTGMETEIIDAIESLNEKIARTVELCSMRMSEITDNIKYYLYS